MRTRRLHALAALTSALLILGAAGCGFKKIAAPPPPPESLIADEDDRLQGSLFKGDLAVLSNQEIDKILGSRLVLTDRHRLAVLRLNQRAFWSEELSDLETQNSEQFLQALRGSPQLTQVRFVPPLLIPEKRTVPYLREAAARFQSDLLLVYSTRVQNFRHDRLLGPDEVRARCIVDSVLLDVRTGIIAYSAQNSQSVIAKKTAGDLSFSETVAKAETNATGKALLKIAESTVAYLRDSAGSSTTSAQ